MDTLLVMCVFSLFVLAALDLWVGVTNDAVNFLNSAVGSRAGSKRMILTVASLGVLVGALFSDGMMEVARKGVFDPKFFADADGALNIEAIVMIYFGVMAADVIMLDLYNTFGLPTSTTVSIVSELFGASLAVAIWSEGGNVSEGFAAINTGPLLRIYGGIFGSVIASFTLGALVMFFARILLTHDLPSRFSRYGPFWTGFSFSALVYFVIMKGLSHASFVTGDVKAFLDAQMWGILGSVFLLAAVITRIFSHKCNTILRINILAGTCTLAMAFAGNDLVNFIGPTVAAGQAVFVEGVNLSGKLPTPPWALLLAGSIMVFGLWSSKKARTVTDTEVRLAAAGQVKQRFQRNRLSNGIVSSGMGIFKAMKLLLPQSMRSFVDQRTDPAANTQENPPPYDLLRATVNLGVASVIISIATANKLPLSTTYVTFMAAMGASMADRCWQSGDAENRVTGVLTVVGGWLLTTLMASTGAFVAASLLYLLGLGWGVAAVGVAVLLLMIRMARAHKRMFADQEGITDYSIRPVKPPSQSPLAPSLEA